jgi:hypothetical protein
MKFNLNQEMVDELCKEFIDLTQVKCKARFLERGKSHKPSLLSDNQKGVYVFLNENCCFKVGKAGSNSKARWNSHHYNLDKATPSTLPKSMMKDLKRFKEFFPEHKHSEIDALNASNMRKWIQNNTSRIEFVISGDESDFTLNLLEALLQFKLQPEYEGKRA